MGINPNENKKQVSAGAQIRTDESNPSRELERSDTLAMRTSILAFFLADFPALLDVDLPVK